MHHVTSRGLERRAIVRDDRDRSKWLALREEVTPDAIDGVVCAVFGVSPATLHVRRRKRNAARAAAICLCRTLARQSMAAVGQRYGGVGGSAVTKT